METLNNLISSFTPIKLSDDYIGNLSSDPFEHLGVEQSKFERLNSAIDSKNKDFFESIFSYEPEESKEEENEDLTNSPFYVPQTTSNDNDDDLQITGSFQEPTQTRVTGNSVYAKIMNYFLDKKLPKHVAAGIMGNLYAESRLNPSAIGDGGTSGGIDQWHANRFKQLKLFAKKRNKDWKDLDTQLDFLWYELNTSYKSVYDRIKRTANSDSVVNIWGHDYERFAGYKNFNNNNYINRRKYAKYFNNL